MRNQARSARVGDFAVVFTFERWRRFLSRNFAPGSALPCLIFRVWLRAHFSCSAFRRTGTTFPRVSLATARTHLSPSTTRFAMTPRRCRGRFARRATAEVDVPLLFALTLRSFDSARKFSQLKRFQVSSPCALSAFLFLLQLARTMFRHNE